MGFFCTHIDKNQTDIGCVITHRCKARIKPYVIFQRQIIITAGCYADIFLSDDRIDKTIFILSPVINLFINNIGRISSVDPLRHFTDIVILGISGTGIYHNNTRYIPASEKADRILNDRTDPVRFSVIIDFKRIAFKNLCRILKPEMTVQIPEKIFSR